MKKKLYIIVVVIILKNFIFSNTNSAVYVLCYHTFSEKNGIITNSPLNIRTNQLKDQLDILISNNFKFINYEDIISNNVKGFRNILITIDDGHYTIKDVYEKIFKEYNIKPVLFIFPHAIMNKYPYSLKSNDLIFLYREGCVIGSHSYYHNRLDRELYNNKIEVFRKEIIESKNTLEKKYKLKVDIFAYPFGNVIKESYEIIKEASYKMAFGLREKPMYIPVELNDNIYNLPRYMITTNYHKTLNKIINSANNLEKKYQKKITNQ